jgi:hypothetical protein
MVPALGEDATHAERAGDLVVVQGIANQEAGFGIEPALIEPAPARLGLAARVVIVEAHDVLQKMPNALFDE